LQDFYPVNFVVPHVANMKYDVQFSPGNEFLETQLCKNSSQLRSLEGKELSENVPSGKEKSCPEVEEGMSLQQITTKVSRSGGSCSKRPRMSESEKSSSLNKLEESRDASERLGSDRIKSISPNIFCPRKQILFSSYLYFHNLSLDFVLVQRKVKFQSKRAILPSVERKGTSRWPLLRLSVVLLWNWLPQSLVLLMEGTTSLVCNYKSIVLFILFA